MKDPCCFEQMSEAEKVAVSEHMQEIGGFTPAEFRQAIKPLVLLMIEKGVRFVGIERFDGFKVHTTVTMEG